jgi:fucose permease
MLQGYLLLIASALSIAFFPLLPQAVRFFSFGLGLGLAMTSSSMLVASLYSARRGKALSLLNGFWTIGAALCPALASAWVKRWPPTFLFFFIGVSMLIIFAFLLGPARTLSSSAPPAEPSPPGGQHLHLISIFAALGCLYVGVEASVSGWMMTYFHRLPDASLAWAPIAVSVFWIALLSGRMLAPVVLTRLSEEHLLSASIVTALIATAFVLLGRSPASIAVAVVFAGLALGPIYPLCLAKALGSMKESPQAKWVFAFSGSGGAVLPWVTGLLSAHENSLRIGLLVPVVALVAMIVLNRLVPVASTA